MGILRRLVLCSATVAMLPWTVLPARAEFGDLLWTTTPQSGGLGRSIVGVGHEVFMTSLNEQSIRVYDVRDGSFQRQLAIGSRAKLLAHGGSLVAGIPSAEQSSGRIRIMNPLTGSTIADWPSPTPEVGAQFGTDLAVVGDGLAVSAPYAKVGNALDAGRVFLVDPATGTMTKQFGDPTPDSDEFGLSVAAMQSRLVIGSPGEVINGTTAGKAYTYHPFSGVLMRTTSNPEPDEFDGFGEEIVCFGDNYAIAAPGDRVGGRQRAGTVYVYDGFTNNPLYTLENPLPTANAMFGRTMVDVNGDLLVVTGEWAMLFDGATAEQIGYLENPLDDAWKSAAMVDGRLILAGDHTASVFAVPEPSMSVLALLGVGGLGLVCRRLNHPATGAKS